MCLLYGLLDIYGVKEVDIFYACLLCLLGLASSPVLLSLYCILVILIVIGSPALLIKSCFISECCLSILTLWAIPSSLFPMNGLRGELAAAVDVRLS